ncbi:MAG: fumarylacetoacetate hydrolase family protein [Candidatus Acidiferrales bacterium]
MKLCRFQPLEFSAADIHNAPGEVRPPALCGVVEGSIIHEFRDTASAASGISVTLGPTGRSWPVSAVKFLPPSVPSKIVCVGRNYLDHAKELGNEVPTEPLIFLKPPSSIIGSDEPIIIPSSSQRVDFEGEIALVIARRCSHLGAQEPVASFLRGYTCLNDVTARDLQKRDVQFTRGKGFDTFCPIGPFLETDFDSSGLSVETFVNGQRKQSGHTSQMIFSVDVIIRWISQVMTLEPGDVIATGTPAGVGPLSAGDVVEVSVSGVGTLRNPVIGSDEI